MMGGNMAGHNRDLTDGTTVSPIILTLEIDSCIVRINLS